MYDDLVKALREHANKMCVTFKGAHVCGSNLALDAANAIEELANKNVVKWVSVAERLPDAYEDVLLKFQNNQAVGFVDRDGFWGVYSGDGFYTEVAENEPKPTHWTKKLSEPPKENGKSES